MYESEQEYNEELSQLSVELDKCKLEASQHEAVLSSLRLSSDEKISRLQEDKAMLQVCFCAIFILCGSAEENIWSFSFLDIAALFTMLKTLDTYLLNLHLWSLQVINIFVITNILVLPYIQFTIAPDYSISRNA